MSVRISKDVLEYDYFWAPYNVFIQVQSAASGIVHNISNSVALWACRNINSIVGI